MYVGSRDVSRTHARVRKLVYDGAGAAGNNPDVGREQKKMLFLPSLARVHSKGKQAASPQVPVFSPIIPLAVSDLPQTLP